MSQHHPTDQPNPERPGRSRKDNAAHASLPQIHLSKEPDTQPQPDTHTLHATNRTSPRLNVRPTDPACPIKAPPPSRYRIATAKETKTAPRPGHSLAAGADEQRYTESARTRQQGPREKMRRLDSEGRDARRGRWRFPRRLNLDILPADRGSGRLGRHRHAAGGAPAHAAPGA